jgi:acetylornithine deacetylase
MNHPLTPAAIGILRELVAFDSVSRNSNLPIIAYIRNRLEPLGAHIELVPSPDGMKANLIARFGPAIDGGMVWSGHTDVVPVDGQEWHTPPFTLTEKDGILYGRGTADMKSFIACCLALAPQLQDFKKPVYFAFSYDEEVGCLGVPYLVKQLLKSGAKPEVAIIGEPTMTKVVTAHKGVLSYETTVRGLEWHSSQPHLGVNAVQIAAELVTFLAGISRELREHGLRDERFDPPTTTVHVGTLHGGTARNIIPREAVFQWEIRPLPNYDGDKIFDRFQRKCDILQREMQLLSKDTGISTKPLSRMLGVTLPAHAEAVCTRIMHAAGTNRQVAVSFGTEAGVFSDADIPAIICGPGDIQQAHKPNEFIAISQISECLAFLQKLLA